MTVTVLHLAKEKINLLTVLKHFFLHTGVFQMILMKTGTRIEHQST